MRGKKEKGIMEAMCNNIYSLGLGAILNSEGRNLFIHSFFVFG